MVFDYIFLLILSMMLGMLLLLLLMMIMPVGEAIICYECYHCNDFMRTWKMIDCSGSCVTKESTHKLAKPTEASVYAIHKMHYSLRNSILNTRTRVNC